MLQIYFITYTLIYVLFLLIVSPYNNFLVEKKMCFEPLLASEPCLDLPPSYLLTFIMAAQLHSWVGKIEGGKRVGH